MPYNYLIDPVLRNKMKISINGSILIFDESHNLEKWCTESASFDMTQSSIISSIGELYKALEALEEDEDNELNIENVTVLRSNINELIGLISLSHS
jgi:regulator of telomere elongation helicase 1